MAGIAHLQCQAGQPEPALTLIGLLQQHPSSYQQSKDRLAGLERELRAAVSEAQVQMALARGRESNPCIVATSADLPLPENQ